MSDGVRVERTGPATKVIMNRPDARNAVNGPTGSSPLADPPRRPSRAAHAEALANTRVAGGQRRDREVWMSSGRPA